MKLEKNPLSLICKVEIISQLIIFPQDLDTCPLLLIQYAIINAKICDTHIHSRLIWVYIFRSKSLLLKSSPMSLKWPLAFVPRTLPCPRHLPPSRPSKLCGKPPSALCCFGHVVSHQIMSAPLCFSPLLSEDLLCGVWCPTLAAH